MGSMICGMSKVINICTGYEKRRVEVIFAILNQHPIIGI